MRPAETGLYAHCTLTSSREGARHVVFSDSQADSARSQRLPRLGWLPNRACGQHGAIYRLLWVFLSSRSSSMVAPSVTSTGPIWEWVIHCRILATASG